MKNLPSTSKPLSSSEKKTISAFEKLVKKWHESGRADATFINHIHGRDNGLGKRFFEAIAALSVNVAFEAVCLRRNPKTKQIEVYMQQRAKHQTWPGMWHVPGSIFRPGEFPRDVAKRLSELEFKTKIKKFTFITDYFVPEFRGWFLCRVHVVELAGEPSGEGTWWPVTKLPKTTIPIHKNKIIPAAVKAFESL